MRALWGYFFVQLGEMEPLLKNFRAEEEDQLERILQRMDVLVKVRAMGPVTPDPC